MKTKYYKCETCGKIIAVVEDSAGVLSCCGKPMTEISQKEAEDKGLTDKHLPTYTRTKNKVVVRVGNVLHPATKDHYIKWVVLVTNKGLQIRTIGRDKAPVVAFNLDDDEVIEEITSYCNMHSLYTLSLLDSWRMDDCGCDIHY